MGAPNTTTTTTTQRELLIRIAEKQDRMNIDIGEIKAAVKELDSSQGKFQLTYVEEHERVVNSANLAHKKIDEVLIWKIETEKRIKAVEDALVAQKTMNKILVFIATVLGSAVIMYIWSMIVG
jgi:hypothetical protein